MYFPGTKTLANKQVLVGMGYSNTMCIIVDYAALSTRVYGSPWRALDQRVSSWVLVCASYGPSYPPYTYLQTQTMLWSLYSPAVTSQGVRTLLSCLCPGRAVSACHVPFETTTPYRSQLHHAPGSLNTQLHRRRGPTIP
jgi:hypothetical protein